MGQSLVQNYIHLVFSTKHRKPLIHPPVEAELHAYLGGICTRLECPAIKIMEVLKSNSSKWIKTKGAGYRNFYGQDGYGAFSVNPPEVNTVIAYITRQHTHHNKKTFQHEYCTFLKKYQVED